MKNLFLNKSTFGMKVLLIGLTFSIVSCEQNAIEESEKFNDTAFSQSENTEVNEGFGNETITLKKGIRPKSGGKCRPAKGITETPIKDLNASSYKLKFELKFDKNFDFDRGGKVGYGLKIGDGITGCKADDSRADKGGSFRVMWRGLGDKNIDISKCEIDNDITTKGELYPYIYHRDMTDRCGENFDKAFAISRNKWYAVELEFKANTSAKADGKAILKIGESGKAMTTVLNRNINWSNDSKKRNASSVIYHLFRGGSDSNWASHEDGKIEIRNVELGI